MKRNSQAYGFLVLVWVISGVILSSPWVDDWLWYQKVFFLLIPILLSIFLLFSNPDDGFVLWGGIITFLVSQTGLQAQVGSITTSALELVVLVLIFVLVFVNRQRAHQLVHINDLPGYRWLFAFITYSLIIFFLGVARNLSLVNAIIELKGFVVYPLMIYLMLAGLRSTDVLLRLVLFMGLWYAFLSVTAGFDFVNNSSVLATDALAYNDVYRASAEYAPINIFGASAAGMAVLCIGLSVALTKQQTTPFLYRAMGLVLIFGTWTAVARSAIIMLVVGLFVLTLFRGNRLLFFISFAAVVLFLFFYLVPPSLFNASLGRIFQMSDSSTAKRWYYLESGWHALQSYRFLGAGWGQGFFYRDGIGLISSGFIPWYHNDYLNLAVQVGLPGLLLYLGFWGSVARACVDWLRMHTLHDERTPFVLGGFAGLVAFLAGAFFDHLLWRPDIAGLVSWMAGLAVVGMNLPKTMSNDDG